MPTAAQYDCSIVREICDARVKEWMANEDVPVSRVVRDHLLELLDGVQLSRDSAMSLTVS